MFLCFHCWSEGNISSIDNFHKSSVKNALDRQNSAISLLTFFFYVPMFLFFSTSGTSIPFIDIFTWAAWKMLRTGKTMLRRQFSWLPVSLIFFYVRTFLSFSKSGSNIVFIDSFFHMSSVKNPLDSKTIIRKLPIRKHEAFRGRTDEALEWILHNDSRRWFTTLAELTKRSHALQLVPVLNNRAKLLVLGRYLICMHESDG